MNRTRYCPVHGAPLRATSTAYGRLFVCKTPRCTVACWPGRTSTPADAETRRLRADCHRAFDPLWKDGRLRDAFGAHANKQTRRHRAYEWLSRTVGVPFARAHFGMFNAEQCRTALEAIERLRAGVKERP